CERAVRAERARPRCRRRAREARPLPPRAGVDRGITRHTAVAVPGTGHDPGGHVRWLESLSPWPEEFGLRRMQQLLADLGEPQRRYPAIHVVGTNGKSSTTLLTGALLRAEGLHVGAYVS